MGLLLPPPTFLLQVHSGSGTGGQCSFLPLPLLVHGHHGLRSLWGGGGASGSSQGLAADWCWAAAGILVASSSGSAGLLPLSWCE